MPIERRATGDGTTWDGATWDGTTWDENDRPGERAEAAGERAHVRRAFWPKLLRVLAEVPFAEELVAAYYCAFDRDTPRRVQAALLAALAYFILPFDVVPDVMPALGFTDDAAILATAIRMVAGHISERHREAAHRVLERARRREED
ncbi:YkvA family protein [Xanthobacteraceae bacterium Astr-EGSB]|uniref:YkvA family protein n=1 Tax=Astrobacterium formosum TaxID=3069710 RepID=UPI0027AF404C|nr:YkvA family protein [Xanthobacteraceae bacterium Astr-EGSB]